MLREHYGRGPLKAKTYALDDIVVCVMRGSGFTPLEQTMMNAGDGGRVVAMREDLQGMMAERYKDLIERLTQRKVLAFLSQAHIEPDITIEVFFSTVHSRASARSKCSKPLSGPSTRRTTVPRRQSRILFAEHAQQSLKRSGRVPQHPIIDPDPEAAT